MKNRKVTIIRYQELDETEIEWTIRALVYPGTKATRMEPEDPPEVEYTSVTAITPERCPMGKPVKFLPLAFEGIMRLSKLGFVLSDLDDEAIQRASEAEIEDEEAAADYLMEQRRDARLMRDG